MVFRCKKCWYGVAPLLFLMVLLLSCAPQKEKVPPASERAVDLSGVWKFKTGDNRAWAAADFDDTDWDTLRPNLPWERQGYRTYDGYAWYRKHFVLPTSLKTKSFLKDSLVIVIGPVDDTDETYLNGVLLGINGKTVSLADTASAGHAKDFPGSYRVNRRYVLAVDDPRLRWGGENVLAVRVYDHGGLGGLWASEPRRVAMLDVPELVSIDLLSSDFTIDRSQGIYSRRVTVQNRSRSHSFAGKFVVEVEQVASGKLVFKRRFPVQISPGDTARFSYRFKADVGKFHRARYLFEQEGAVYPAVAREEVPYLLTPEPPQSPRINGPVVYGVKPGHPFLFAIPATGRRPLHFSAEGLPAGLSLDSTSGILSGVITKRGRYPVQLVAENDLGRAEKTLTIVVGDTLALTPPLGWNSWNCWGLTVSDAKIRATADLLVSTGLRDHGWTFVNIDDGWEAPRRAPNGEIRSNEKFPDMKALADYVHARGLKLGIYSSPGPRTCGGYLGSYGHEYQDAATWARWGIDYLKYDWCSYERIARDHSLPELQKPYRLMRKALDAVDRDIVFSLCQYGMGEVWKWGAEVGGNLWRTTGDITDTWESMSRIGFGQADLYPYAGPGHWNDPDMLVVGWVGWSENLHRTRLTVNEQYTHISLWSLLSAPLLLGCDLSRMNAFTLNLLTNDEVLAVDQDPLGRQARRVLSRGKVQVWLKELADGSRAIGIFNLGEKRVRFTLNWADIGLAAKQTVRDLWRQQDLGTFTGSFSTLVFRHGVVLIRVNPAD